MDVYKTSAYNNAGTTVTSERAYLETRGIVQNKKGTL